MTMAAVPCSTSRNFEATVLFCSFEGSIVDTDFVPLALTVENRLRQATADIESMQLQQKWAGKRGNP